MPLFSPKRNISDTEYKLRILCCLDALGMATQEQLWPFAAQLELMEYIPFCMFLDELKTAGAVASASHGLEGTLYLTAEGKEQLRLFLRRMPHTDQERIRAAAPEYAARLSERRHARTVYERAPKGEYRASCSMSDGDVPTLFLRITSEDQTLVQKAVKDFQRYVGQLFVLLYSLPFEPAQQLPAAMDQDAALKAAAPGSPVLCDFGGREHAGVIRICDKDACFTLMLLLPDDTLAWGWARMADELGAALAGQIVSLLRSHGSENA
ncbi:MAG: DUF4364 family protein [Clostridia bacterium]|nr:DUF4364 family protein [Clostridia bacterium]